MELDEDLELLDGMPLLYIRSIKALAISDLHLGYEGTMAKSGILVPKANLSSIIKILDAGLSGREVKTLIIVGDIKNGFSKLDPDELNELREIANLARKKRLAVCLVKGNHDNFIETYSSSLGITVTTRRW